MSDLSQPSCAACGDVLERVRYYPRQLLTADDLRLEQDYLREKMRRHNRLLHGWGVVCGCEVKPLNDAKRWMVRVCPGFAVGPQGDDIQISDCVDIDLMLGVAPQDCSVRCPCPPMGEMAGNDDGPTLVYIAVRYAECMTRPARVHPSGCGCDEANCEYSRIRESFEIKVLWQLPASHVDAAKADQAWCDQLRAAAKDGQRHGGLPVPPCPPCASEPWVVLATVAFPAQLTPTSAAAQQLPGLQVSTLERRVLLSTSHFQVASQCPP